MPFEKGVPKTAHLAFLQRRGLFFCEFLRYFKRNHIYRILKTPTVVSPGLNFEILQGGLLHRHFPGVKQISEWKIVEIN